MNPTKFILLCLAGWINREQQAVIEYLGEEFNCLQGEKDDWTAGYFYNSYDMVGWGEYIGEGKTPEEAVANLILNLSNHDSEEAE